MSGPSANLIGDGSRLHLRHGPMDLVIGADPVHTGGRRAAFGMAVRRFETILVELVRELPILRTQVTDTGPEPQGRVARRMYLAAKVHGAAGFVTPMAAVAGAVAEEILAAMTAATPLLRAHVNNGGDIALHLAPGQTLISAVAGLDGRDLGRVEISAATNIRGIATSGQGGRSLSFGIADSVTVLARSAAAADVAATLVANAVTLPDHPCIKRVPARELQPDSDLGGRPVVSHIGALSADGISTALDAGQILAQDLIDRDLIAGAFLVLRNSSRVVGTAPGILTTQTRMVEHA